MHDACTFQWLQYCARNVLGISLSRNCPNGQECHAGSALHLQVGNSKQAMS